MNLTRIFLLVLALAAADLTYALEGIEEDLTPIHTLMADVIAKINAHRVDEAVTDIVNMSLPVMNESVRLDWKKKLLGLMMTLEERNIRSLEMVAFDKISSRCYQLHYVLHGNLGPHLITFKAYRYEDKWYTVGFSYIFEFERLASALGKKQILNETLKIQLPVYPDEPKN